MSRVKTTVGETLRSLLVADAAMTALVAGRVYPNRLPQASDLPAIVYTVISGTPELSLTGKVDTTLAAYRVQVDCYARPSAAGGAYAQAHAVSKRAAQVLGDVADADLCVELTGNERDVYDNETEYHGVQLDFTIWI